MKPFDLKAAMRGMPIIYINGSKPAKFIAHVPDAQEGERVIVLLDGSICLCDEKGRIGAVDGADFYMAPPEKRTAYLNLWRETYGRLYSTVHGTEEAAQSETKDAWLECLVRARPIEYEEYEPPADTPF